MMRFGLIGLGGIGLVRKSALEQSEACELTAAFDLNQTLLDDLPAHVARFNDADSLLKSDSCDAVIISTPTHFHEDLAIAALEKHIKPEQHIRVVPLYVKYPQGAEKMLIKAIFDKEVPAGQLPRDLGMAVNNVGTIVAIADWFDQGMPLIERILTVSGPGVKNPSNLIVPLGTSVREVLHYCGGLTDNAMEIIMGGPMMGMPIASLDVPILKGTSGLLAFTETAAFRPKEYPCIRCGRCLEACPHFLNPSRLARLSKARLFDEMQNYFVMDCVECGSCTYSCPSGIPIVQLIRTAKSQIRQPKAKTT